MINHYGRGKALYLNFPVEGYLRERHLGQKSGLRDILRKSLQWAGMEPQVKVSRDGVPLDATEIARFQR